MLSRAQSFLTRLGLSMFPTLGLTLDVTGQNESIDYK